MIFFIEKIKIELTENQYGLQLERANGATPLPGQTLAEATDTIQKNFESVKAHYGKLASETIPPDELNEVCLKIVLHYFYLYNSWKYSNEKEKDRDLTFLPKDFQHPNTYDLIINYFKNKYPKDYAIKCASLIEKTADELLKYEYDQAAFYNAFR
jgi:hypothetical protein